MQRDRDTDCTPPKEVEKREASPSDDASADDDNDDRPSDTGELDGLGQAGTAEPQPGIAEYQGGGIEGAIGGGQSGQGGG